MNPLAFQVHVDHLAHGGQVFHLLGDVAMCTRMVGGVWFEHHIHDVLQGATNVGWRWSKSSLNTSWHLMLKQPDHGVLDRLQTVQIHQRKVSVGVKSQWFQLELGPVVYMDTACLRQHQQLGPNAWQQMGLPHVAKPLHEQQVSRGLVAEPADRERRHLFQTILQLVQMFDRKLGRHAREYGWPQRCCISTCDLLRLANQVLRMMCHGIGLEVDHGRDQCTSLHDRLLVLSHSIRAKSLGCKTAKLATHLIPHVPVCKVHLPLQACHRKRQGLLATVQKPRQPFSLSIQDELGPSTQQTMMANAQMQPAFQRHVDRPAEELER